DKLLELYENSHISEELFLNLIPTRAKLGTFKILPKLHKKTFTCRPIINYKNHPTTFLCILVDLILRPFVKEYKSFLATGDFDSLYSNIDHSDCINVIGDFLRDKLISSHISLVGFIAILNLILENNYFSFKEFCFFVQKLGIAMGSKCGPSIANIYVYCYEKKWLYIYRPFFYVRYIDDIFVVFDNLDILETLRRAFGSLKLNIEHKETVNFLDLNITLDKFSNNLVFDLYSKPTNTFCYLSTFSNHPDFIFENLPKFLFIKIRRICSNLTDFTKNSLRLTKQLIERGYIRSKIDKVFNMVFKLDRNDLLDYKIKPFREKDVIDFKINFDINSKDFKGVFKKAFVKYFGNIEETKKLRFRLINKMQNNLSSILVHDFKFPVSKSFCYQKCSNVDCSICRFADISYSIKLKDNFFLPIWDISSCNSLNCVYVIYCKLCNEYYIGRTNSIKKRIYKHIYDIKNFKPFKLNSTSISIHFNLKFHIFQEHFKFYIYRNNLSEKTRLNLECFLINLFLKYDLKLINDFILNI
ncbi:unnamed protein product, partial [Brachionus calyciflorus]